MSWHPGRKVVLSTNRFVLREYTPDDKQQFIDYQTDPAFTVFHHPDELGADQAAKVFEMFIGWQEEAPRRNYQFAITKTDAIEKIIGSGGVRMHGCQEGEAEFGIELAHSYWGRYRYAEELGNALIDWAFTQFRLSAIVVDTALDNAAVARLADAAGFVRTIRSDKQWWRLERESWNRR
ncbi:hypothetical protein SRABI118_03783 [Massilia sp. Bi118]|uniref:GNAT family N-acetyltransferase n=1 Tax=Massilia sp. Bi118 TaxID=2822346 RepID=UPI001DC3C934|nr:GNAT family N-acetyltransferase [Massilia sp. Bi118]CAH0281180.1 hypothetical protein SRABI118_03783 [Massilia sp. Bi118]